MDNIIHYLFAIIQVQQKQIHWLLLLICKYISLKQWAHDDSHSPEYQKFKVDETPVIIKHEMFDYKELIDYFYIRYKKRIKPVSIRKNSKRNVPEDTFCPRCGAPHTYLYDNNGGERTVSVLRVFPNL